MIISIIMIRNNGNNRKRVDLPGKGLSYYYIIIIQKNYQNRAPELRIKVSYTVFHAEFEFHIGLSRNSLPEVEN